MDDKIVKCCTENVHLHSGVLFTLVEYQSAINNNGFMKFLGKWMVLENILSEVILSQKNTHGMYSLISEY